MAITKLSKPVTRSIRDRIVVTLEKDGLRLRVFRGRKSVLIPWSEIADLAVDLANRKPDKLFEPFKLPKKQLFADLSLRSLAALDQEKAV